MLQLWSAFETLFHIFQDRFASEKASFGGRKQPKLVHSYACALANNAGIERYCVVSVEG